MVHCLLLSQRHSTRTPSLPSSPSWAWLIARWPTCRWVQVQLTSSAAQEESSFLTEHMQSLLDDRSGMKEALDKAQRQADYLLQENELLRQELLGGWRRRGGGRAKGELLHL